jgi:myo-inositol 2-dehydrogenase/D-chiro-inositol 1-dehydrogenase
MTMRDSVRAGIIGCGFIANVHSWALWALRKTKQFDVRVTAVCDADHDRATKLAEPNKADVLNLDELLRAVDVVYVCAPTAEHLALVKAAAEHKLPVFCEKPLAPDLRTANRVGAWLDRVPHQVGLVLRTSPVFEAMRDEVASGRHGRPMAVTMRDDQYFPVQGQYASDWRAKVDVAGGGTLIEHSIHDVDLFRWLLGEPGEVACRTSSFFGHPGVEDLAIATFSYPATGLIANLVSVWHQVLTRGSTRRLEVFCEDAHLWTDDDTTGPLRIETTDGVEERACTLPAWVDELPVPAENRATLGLYAEASRRFLAAVSAGTTGSPAASDAVAAHRLVDAAYRSASQGGAPLPL